MGNVEALRRRSRLRLLRLRSILRDSYSLLQHDAALAAAAFVSIDGLNLWSEFARSYLRFALRHDETRSGVPITTGFPRGTTLEQALVQIPSVLRRPPGATLTRLHEPAWHSRRSYLKTARLAGLSTLAQVEAALALPLRFTEDLPVARNFFAHKNSETAEKVRNLARRYSMARVKHPCDLVLGVAPGRPVVVLEDWLAEIEMVIEIMSS